jgi:hypothetical protein
VRNADKGRIWLFIRFVLSVPSCRDSGRALDAMSSQKRKAAAHSEERYDDVSRAMPRIPNMHISGALLT